MQTEPRILAPTDGGAGGLEPPRHPGPPHLSGVPCRMTVTMLHAASLGMLRILIRHCCKWGMCYGWLDILLSFEPFCWICGTVTPASEMLQVFPAWDCHKPAYGCGLDKEVHTVECVGDQSVE